MQKYHITFFLHHTKSTNTPLVFCRLFTAFITWRPSTNGNHWRLFSNVPTFPGHWGRCAAGLHFAVRQSNCNSQTEQITVLVLLVPPRSHIHHGADQHWEHWEPQPWSPQASGQEEERGAAGEGEQQGGGTSAQGALVAPVRRSIVLRHPPVAGTVSSKALALINLFVPLFSLSF